MKLIACDLPEGTNYRWGRNMRLIREFLDSDMECAEVVPEGDESFQLQQKAASLLNTIKKQRFAGVRAVQRQGKVYLVRVTL